MTLNEAKQYTSWFFWRLTIFYFIVVLVGKTPIGRDDSDPSDWGARSGFIVRTDSKTECQYLETSGGITPRLDRYGNHVGCRQ